MGEFRIKIAELGFAILGMLIGIMPGDLSRQLILIVFIPATLLYLLAQYHKRSKLTHQISEAIQPVVDAFYKTESYFKNLAYKYNRDGQLSEEDLAAMETALDQAATLYDKACSFYEDSCRQRFVSKEEIRHRMERYFSARSGTFHLPILQGTLETYASKSSGEMKEIVRSIAEKCESLSAKILEAQLCLDIVSGFKVSIDGVYYVRDAQGSIPQQFFGSGSVRREGMKNFKRYRDQLLSSSRRVEIRTEIGLVMADISFVLLVFALSANWP